MCVCVHVHVYMCVCVHACAPVDPGMRMVPESYSTIHATTLFHATLDKFSSMRGPQVSVCTVMIYQQLICTVRTCVCVFVFVCFIVHRR